MEIESEDVQRVEEVWARSKHAGESFIKYVTTNMVEALNWSVPWYSYEKGSWSIVYNAEKNLIVKLRREPKCPVEVLEVFRRTYSIPQNIQELIMNRGFWRSYREKNCTKGCTQLKQIKGSQSKDN